MTMKAIVAAALLAVPVSASAATVYELEATADFTSVDGFSLTFEDLDGDMLFSEDELLTFSGVQFNFGGEPFFTRLTGVPEIAGISDGIGTLWQFNDAAVFGGGGSGNTGVRSFSYNVSEFAPVPLPAAGLMLLAGLGGMAALRRRKRA